MALTPLNDDLNIISKLPDEPNDSDQHDGAWLKGKFDEAGNTIKNYINGTLLPELEVEQSASGVVSEPFGSVTATNVQDALEAVYTIADEAQGGIVADGSVTTAKLADEAVTTAKIYDEAVTHAKLSDNAVAANNITDGEVTDGKLAANSVNAANIKSGAVSAIYTGTITTEDWDYAGPPYMEEIGCTGMVSGTAVVWGCTSTDPEVLAAYALCTFAADTDAIIVSSDEPVTVDIPIVATQSGTTYMKTVTAVDMIPTGMPYAQDVPVAGLLEADHPIVDLLASEDYDTAEAELGAWAVIYKMSAGNDKLTVYSQEITDQDVDIQILCVRK